jgi:hypothetical protein
VDGLNMERRVQRLETAFCPPWEDQLRTLATQAAEQHGLDPELVFQEAMVVLREIGERRLSVHDLAVAEGLSPDDLTRMTRQLRAYWQEIA